jgi:hypothetical protein
MKINPYFRGAGFQAGRRYARPAKRTGHEQGSAAMVVIAIVAIVLLYVASNLRTLDHLNREIKQVERRQIRRLEHVSISTNSVTDGASPVVPAPVPLHSL